MKNQNYRSYMIVLKSAVFIAFISTMIVNGQTIETTVDESKVPQYVLPELLKSSNGEEIDTPEKWNKLRRPEILDLFETQVYGKSPAKPAAMTFSVTKSLPNALGGKARLKEIRIRFLGTDEGPFLNLLLLLPKESTGRKPIFLMPNFSGNQTIHPTPEISLTTGKVSKKRGGDENENATEKSRGARESSWCVEEILKNGYGLATYHYADIDPDHRKRFDDGIHPYFYKEGQEHPAADEWGAISAWAWGLSRAMDYLESDKEVDAGKVIVLGHSRLGKTALWAGAQDQRFAMVISNNSGCGGAALSRRRFGESVAKINQSFPHWFCDNFNKYSGHEDNLPVDQHMLIALIAPRPVYVASATKDRWADPKGEYLSAFHAQKVYKLFGFESKISDWPAPDKPVMGRVGYHLRTGKHAVTLYDWQQYIKFANQHLKNNLEK